MRTATTSVSTTNVKGFTFASEGVESDGKEIAVKVNCELPETFEEASSLYGGEKEAMDALAQDWQRRCVNAARPLLRNAETELDWESVAQQAIDTYKPGRRGGFTPKVSESDLEQFDSIDELKEFLRKQGAVRVGE